MFRLDFAPIGGSSGITSLSGSTWGHFRSVGDSVVVESLVLENTVERLKHGSDFEPTQGVCFQMT
jgi:hypothetical protein